MSEEHTDVSGEATDIGPALNDVQAMHQEALDLVSDEGGDDAEPDSSEGEPDGEPEDVQATGDDEADADGDLEASDDDGTDDVDNPDDKLDKKYKSMQADYTRKTQDLADQRREIEADRKRMMDLVNELESRKATPATEQPALPSRPSDEATASEWTDYWEKHQAHQARIAHANAPETQQYREYMAQQEQQRALYDAGQKSVEHIRARDGYSEEIENRMGQVAQADQFWAGAIYSTDGADKLFDLVSKQIAEESAAKKAEAKIRRAAKAADGKVTPPGSKSRVKPPAKAFADMSVDDLNAEARRLAGIE